MIKKILPVLLVLGGLLSIFFFLPEGFGLREVRDVFLPGSVENDGEEDYNGAEQEPERELPEELYHAVKLDRLLGKTPPDGMEGLMELSTREDAVGYEASLTLARQYEQYEEINPELFYRRALSLHETNDVQEELALYLKEEVGKEDAAAEEFLQLLPGEDALKALEELQVPPETIIEALARKEHWATLVSFVQERSDSSLTGPAERYYLKALVQAGRYETALPLLEERVQEEETSQELIWHYARALEISGKPEKALEYYEAAGERGLYRRGIILANQGKTAEAAEVFSATPEPEGRWRGAHLWESLDDPQKALPVYMDLAQDESSVQDDAAYRAYVLLSRDGDERADEFLPVIASSPAWMERLDKEPQRELEPEQTLEEPLFIRRIEAYREHRLGRLADLELAIQLERVSPQERLALGQWYLEQGNYFRAVRHGIRLLRERPCLNAYRLAYPKPYLEEVRQAAEEYQLDPYLLLAVMREESHYRADVTSVAGARGLMQIMPSTGQDIADRKNEDFELEMLFDPETSIRFGAFYLRSVLDMFDGDLDQALAAYNAGPGHARRWGNSDLGQEPLGFPTAITFIETREYITKVKDSYLNYLWLYEEENQ